LNHSNIEVGGEKYAGIVKSDSIGSDGDVAFKMTANNGFIKGNKTSVLAIGALYLWF
jgi:hypothetical protein